MKELFHWLIVRKVVMVTAKSKKKIVYIIGTRPEVIRSATVIKALKADPEIDFKLVHTGQHYDYLMDKVFFEEFDLPDPDINLNSGSGSHAEQTASIMIQLEKFILKFQPDILAVFGDTNSSLAAGITAIKMGVPLAHIEAGCREWEMDMPEEINRRLIDHCSTVNLTVSKLCVENLEKEHVMGDTFFVGDPLYDVFVDCVKSKGEVTLPKELNLPDNTYVLMTAHRGKNVDEQKSLDNIFRAVANFPEFKFVFPLHPRTRKNIDQFLIKNKDIKNVILAQPLGYHEMIRMVQGAKFVLTDSGGLQKEVFWSKKPCITMRYHTAWVETVEAGVNILSTTKKEDIIKNINYIIKNYDSLLKKFATIKNPYLKGNATTNIVTKLKKYSKNK